MKIGKILSLSVLTALTFLWCQSCSGQSTVRLCSWIVDTARCDDTAWVSSLVTVFNEIRPNVLVVHGVRSKQLGEILAKVVGPSLKMPLHSLRNAQDECTTSILLTDAESISVSRYSLPSSPSCMSTRSANPRVSHSGYETVELRERIHTYNTSICYCPTKRVLEIDLQYWLPVVGDTTSYRYRHGLDKFYRHALIGNSPIIIFGAFHVTGTSDSAFQRLMNKRWESMDSIDLVTGDLVLTNDWCCTKSIDSTSLFNHVGESYQLIDPLSITGYWYNNPEFRYYHTSYEHFAGTDVADSAVGVNNRSNMILLTDSLMKYYVPGSYTTFGNDGKRFGQDVNLLPNQSVSDSVAQALSNLGHQLPIYLDLDFSKE